jgi:uncharacterized protein YprB with RNaseH-like and TPR domain
MQSGEVLCWAAKWVGDEQIFFSSKNQTTKKNMLKKIHKLLDQADAVVTYNGNSFDLPILNGEFAKLGLYPPAPSKSIDLLKIVKAKFRFPSNKLAYVAPALGCGEKMGNSGHELWVKCMAGDVEAWREMERYNINDTILLESLFNKLRPWMRGIWSPDTLGCRTCGSHNLQRRGYHHTTVSTFQRLQCQDCGSWMRSGVNEVTTEQRKGLMRPL